MPDKKSSRVMLFKSFDPYNETSWQDQFAWLQTTLERFDAAFRPLFITMFKVTADE
jgi:hypothetical protein